MTLKGKTVSHRDLANSLIAIVGEKNVSADVEKRKLFSSDLAFDAEFPAIFIVAPRSKEELRQVVRETTSNGFSVVARGGGLSYTRGYVPEVPNTIIIDTRQLDRITEINESDLYITAEAGCTWVNINQELEKSGFRLPHFGPASGRFSTIGGGLSQNSIFFGSAQYGSAADHVSSLEVVLADGGILRTGTAAITGGAPFFRHHGPDLTGLFIGDCGALGIKTSATMRLIELPPYQEFLAFRFSDFESMVGIQSLITRKRIAAECLGIGSYELFNAGKITELYIVAEGYNKGQLAEHVNYIRDASKGLGKEIDADIPRMIREQSFNFITSVLDPEGRLQMWTHGVVPFSRAAVIYRKLVNFFDKEAAVLERHGIDVSITAAPVGSALILEPVMRWCDELLPRHVQFFSADRKYQQNRSRDNDSDSTAAVSSLRLGLRDLFSEERVGHLQIGKFYQYRETLNSESWKLIVGLKKTLDPKNLMNPGALQLET